MSWARLASFCQLGFISDPLIVSKFHNETHDSKGQENKIKAENEAWFYSKVTVSSCAKIVFSVYTEVKS